jgi:deoxyribose-phosphate aldolase
MVYDMSTAKNSREHNNANILTLGAGLIGTNLAIQIADLWLSTNCTEDRHLRRAGMIEGTTDGSTVPSQPSELSETDISRITAQLENILGGRLPQQEAPCVGSCPDTARDFIKLGATGLTSRPATGKPGDIPQDLAKYIDHTILKANATESDIQKICAEARKHSFRSVCVNPTWVKKVSRELAGSGVLTCSVVGFPLGASCPEIKAMETRRAIRDGAKEIDMVVNVGALIGGDTETVLKDIRAVTEACRDGGAVSKVIIETALLDDDQKRTVCELAKKARANFVKTSTGFSTGGATAEDIALMSSIVASAGMEVKASGGIKSFDDVQEMISAGATRIGASASIAILSQAGK